MSVLTAVSANTFRGTGSNGTYLTPDGMPIYIAYATKRKQKCSILLFEYFADISVKGQYCNAFLVYSFQLSKASAKLRRIIHTAKFLFGSSAKRIGLVVK